MTRNHKASQFVIWTIVGDIAAIVLSVILTYYVRFMVGIVPIRDVPPFAEYIKTLYVVIPVYLWFFRAYHLYRPARTVRRIEEIFKVVKAITFSVVILMAATFLYRALTYSRIYLAVLWIVSISLVSFSRYLLIQWEYSRKRNHKDLTQVVVVGVNRNARNIINWAKSNPHYGQVVVGVMSRDHDLVGKHFEGVPVIGNFGEIETQIKETMPDQVVLVDPEFSREQITDLVAFCENEFIEFKVAADFFGLLTKNVEVEYISSVPLLGFKTLPLDDAWNRSVKRLLDVVVSGVMLICVSPLMGIAAVMIKFESKGPIFYFQERMGRDQILFNLIKFRTMKINAEAASGPVWTIENDDRRTRIGNFLRRWNIDELPQLINVLRGDMSLVGPRPERPHFISQFRESIPRYMARHKVKAGITGWAQVNGFRGNTSIQERIKYDLYYMENWSLLFDIEILFMTLMAFKNAY